MTRPATAALALTLVLGCTTPQPPPEADPASRRDPEAGPVVGKVGRYGEHAWLGIPYAQAPIGDLRWRAPRPAASWSDVRETLAVGSPCPQYTSRFAGVEGPEGTVVGDEDCLSLNVYAPRVAPGDVPSGDARLPVMVWIHGGGNVIGHAGFYDGGNLAVTENVVVVAVNYRLGPLGWLRHAALRGDGTTPEDRSGNYGTLDVIRALGWVRDNVAAFGGDPGNVTVFGESAGGRDVYALLQSPLARGLFHRAIVQSGGLRQADLVAAESPTDAVPPGDADSSGEVLLRLLQRDGTASDRDAAKAHAAGMSSEEIERYLRGKSAQELLAVYDPVRAGLIRVPQMFPDGTVLPAEDALESFAHADGHAGVPVMIGTNRDEEKLFLFADPSHVDYRLWILPRLVDAERYDAMSEHVTRLWKAIGADEPAAALARGGAPGVYLYRFDWDEEPTVAGADLGRMLGAAHAFEIPFVFGHFDLGPEINAIFTDENEPARRVLAAQMMSYWAEFARTGKPGRGTRGDLPAWEPGPRFMVLDTAAGGGLRMAEESLTEEAVLAAIPRDARLRDDEERCRVAREVIARASRLDASALDPSCRSGAAS